MGPSVWTRRQLERFQRSYRRDGCVVVYCGVCFFGVGWVVVPTSSQRAVHARCLVTCTGNSTGYYPNRRVAFCKVRTAAASSGWICFPWVGRDVVPTSLDGAVDARCVVTITGTSTGYYLD